MTLRRLGHAPGSQAETDWHNALANALTPLAAAREYEMSHPTIPTPVKRDLCATCGGPREWRAWVSFSGRCESDWHA